MLFFPSSSIEVDGSSSDFDLGSDLSAQLIVEGLFEVGPRTAIALRGQGGLITLFPGGDLEDEIDDEKRACDQSGTSCDVEEGPFLGWTAGGGVGVVTGTGNVALRADLLLSWYGLKVFESSIQDNTLTTNATGNRILLMGGVEL